MPTEANPHHFSKQTKDDVAISQIEDAVDFPPVPNLRITTALLEATTNK